MMNDANLEIAFEWVKEEYARPIPIGFKKCYGEILKQANAFRVIGLRHQARKGGKAPKTGSLQQFIVRCVQSSPDIRERELLRLLKKQPSVAIDQESDCLAGEPRLVHFIDEAGSGVSATIRLKRPAVSRQEKDSR